MADRLTTANYVYHDCEFMDSGMSQYMNRLAELEDVEEQRNNGHEKQISDWTLQEAREHCRSHSCNNDDSASCKLFGTLCKHYSFGIPSGFSIEEAESALSAQNCISE